MSNKPIVPKPGGFYVTQLGREALAELASCDCRMQLDGGLFVCTCCGTVWAKVSTVTAVLRAGGTFDERA